MLTVTSNILLQLSAEGLVRWRHGVVVNRISEVVSPQAGSNPVLTTKLKYMEEKLTEWEKEYIDEHLTERVKTDCYWDNPDLATEDVKWLLEVIKKLRS